MIKPRRVINVIELSKELGEAFFVSRLLGIVYAAGSKKKGKKTH